MITQRFNPNPEWKDPNIPTNKSFAGIFSVAYRAGEILHQTFPGEEIRMIEIGSYMGESTQVFASSQGFNHIIAIDPLDGYEEFSEMFNYDWKTVEKEFKINTRYFDNITLLKDYSYNVVDTIEDNSQHMVYIDGDHSYAGVKRDIELFLPKIKEGGIIAGHDFTAGHGGVIDAVFEFFDRDLEIFDDESWWHIIKPKKNGNFI
jgi:hypothetical protein